MAYPQPFLEPLGERLADVLASTLPAEGQAFDVSGITPQVAQVSPLIQQAQQRTATQAGLGTLQFSPDTGAVTGVTPGTGIAQYEPFLERAEALLDPSAYQSYMSPYQQEVIDTTQALLDEQRAAGRSRLAAEAIGQGAFGSGREGVQRAEYERQRDISDAATIAGLREAGLARAQALQQQALGNVTTLPQIQQQLGRGITQELGLAGTGAQQYSQSILDAARQANVIGQTFPLQQLAGATNIFGGIAQGTPGAVYSPPPVTSPALTAAQAFGSVYGGLAPQGGLASLYR